MMYLNLCSKIYVILSLFIHFVLYESGIQVFLICLAQIERYLANGFFAVKVNYYVAIIVAISLR